MFSKIMFIVFLLATFMLHVTPFDDLNSLAHCAAMRDIKFAPGMTRSEFNKAYGRLSIFYHPDKNIGEKSSWAEAKMRDLNSARDEALQMLQGKKIIAISPQEELDALLKRLDSKLNVLNAYSEELRVLDLRCQAGGRKINEIPDDFFVSLAKLVPDLKGLDLGSNGLNDIPCTIAKLQSLEALAIDNNKFEVFPVCIYCLTNLAHLDLSSNILQEIPADIGRLTNLRQLFLQNNKIKELPNSIANLPKLSSVELKNNAVTLGDSVVVKKLKSRRILVDI